MCAMDLGARSAGEDEEAGGEHDGRAAAHEGRAAGRRGVGPAGRPELLQPEATRERSADPAAGARFGSQPAWGWAAAGGLPAGGAGGGVWEGGRHELRSGSTTTGAAAMLESDSGAGDVDVGSGAEANDDQEPSSSWGEDEEEAAERRGQGFQGRGRPSFPGGEAAEGPRAGEHERRGEAYGSQAQPQQQEQEMGGVRGWGGPGGREGGEQPELAAPWGWQGPGGEQEAAVLSRSLDGKGEGTAGQASAWQPLPLSRISY
jgi:hypothetical protein